MIIDTRIKEILSNLKIDGLTTTITEQLDRKEYLQVNEVFDTLGAKWNRQKKCHVWTSSPSEQLKVFISGESGTLTTTLETSKEKKKTFQYYGTPAPLADELVRAATYVFPYNAPASILEPSAGRGSLVQAVHREWPNAVVDTYELMEENRAELQKINGCRILGDDFLKHDASKKYELILGNPPFQKHQDITHVKKMYEAVEDGGALISITSNHWKFASHKVDKEFREWIESVDGEVNEIEAGAFKESGTAVSANYIVVRK